MAGQRRSWSCFSSRCRAVGDMGAFLFAPLSGIGLANGDPKTTIRKGDYEFDQQGGCADTASGPVISANYVDDFCIVPFIAGCGRSCSSLDLANSSANICRAMRSIRAISSRSACWNIGSKRSLNSCSMGTYLEKGVRKIRNAQAVPRHRERHALIAASLRRVGRGCGGGRGPKVRADSRQRYSELRVVQKRGLARNPLTSAVPPDSWLGHPNGLGDCLKGQTVFLAE